MEDLLVAGNGDVYLSGWHRGSFFGSPLASGYDGYLMRATASGSPVWINRLAGLSDDFFTGIASTTEPNELVGGAFYFFQASFGGTTLGQSVGTTSALVRVDTMGTLLEAVQPEVLAGYSLIADVQSDLFGNFYLCGDVGGEVRFGPDTLQCLSQDMYVSKISPQLSTPVQDATRSQPRQWSVHPNPTNGPVTITGPLRSGQLDLIDGQGALVRSFRTVGEGRSIDLSGLSSGIYLLTDRQGGHARIVLEGDH